MFYKPCDLQSRINPSFFLRVGLASAICMSVFVSSPVFAHDEHNDISSSTAQHATEFYESLDASPGIPMGFSADDVVKKVQEAGGSEKDADIVLSTFEGDPCEKTEIRPICAYFGPNTLSKATNLAWQMSNAGVNADQIEEAVSEVFQIGVEKQLAEIYGEDGITDEKLAAVAGKYGIKPPEGRSVKDRGLECLWLRTAIDEQLIPSTGPLFFRKYRLVTCGFGLNAHWTWRIFGWKRTFQFGLAAGHSRFARGGQIGNFPAFWFSTGAEPHICTRAEAVGSVNNKCNAMSWKSPFASKLAFDFFKGGPRAVNLRGHAHRLGHSFNTYIGW